MNFGILSLRHLRGYEIVIVMTRLHSASNIRKRLLYSVEICII